MADRYANFAELFHNERLDIDYRVLLAERGTAVVVLAPHGGQIEPTSSEVAKAIARDDYSFYAFEGLRRGRPHGDLHITSTRFEEPQGLKLVTSAATVIAIHGRVDGIDPHSVWIGGRDDVLGAAIALSLNAASFRAVAAEPRLAGRDRMNICNRGTSGAGVQLELPRSLRDQLARDAAKLELFSHAVREAISTVTMP